MDWSSPSSSDTSCSPSCLGEKLHIDSEAESEVVDPATQPTATLGLPAAMPRNDTRGPVSGCPVRPTEPTRVAQLYPDYETIKSPSGILKSIRMAPSNMDMAVGQGTRVKCEPSSEPSYRISDRYRRGAVDKDLDNPERRMRRRELSQLSTEEAERIVRRRERNKVAATKCRHKRREQHESLVKELQDMECDNTSLTYEIRQLQRQRQALSDALRHHQMGCTQGHLLPPPTHSTQSNLSESFPTPYPLHYT